MAIPHFWVRDLQPHFVPTSRLKKLKNVFSKKSQIRKGDLKPNVDDRKMWHLFWSGLTLVLHLHWFHWVFIIFTSFTCPTIFFSFYSFDSFNRFNSFNALNSKFEIFSNILPWHIWVKLLTNFWIQKLKIKQGLRNMKPLPLMSLWGLIKSLFNRILLGAFKKNWEE